MRVGVAREVSTSVDRVCSEVRGNSGDIEMLIALAVRRVAPLATAAERDAISAGSLARLCGLGEREILLDDPSVDEVLVNAGHEIWIERAGSLERAALALHFTKLAGPAPGERRPLLVPARERGLELPLL